MIRRFRKQCCHFVRDVSADRPIGVIIGLRCKLRDAARRDAGGGPVEPACTLPAFRVGLLYDAEPQIAA